MYSKQNVLDMFYTMYKIRLFEETASERYSLSREIFGTLHLCIGQEATAVGVCKNLRKSDYIITNHRGHGHMIAKGASLYKMAAELLGREDGYCRGKGGSMHITDLDVGCLCANAILGSGITIATGSAFTSRYLNQDAVTVCFFGDGAFSEGALHEALNISALWKLPVIYICENNGYALSTPYEKTIAIRDLSKIAIPYGIPSVTIDGNDVIEVYKKSHEYIENARQGFGSAFIECKTYRTCGHYESETEDVKYRTNEEIEYWKNKDPIFNFERYLLGRNDFESSEIIELKHNTEMEVLEAFERASQCNYPNIRLATEDVYTDVVVKGRERKLV